MKYAKLQEEELKNKDAQFFIGRFDCKEILKNIDFFHERSRKKLLDPYFLWTEGMVTDGDAAAFLQVSEHAFDGVAFFYTFCDQRGVVVPRSFDLYAINDPYLPYCFGISRQGAPVLRHHKILLMICGDGRAFCVRDPYSAAAGRVPKPPTAHPSTHGAPSFPLLPECERLVSLIP